LRQGLKFRRPSADNQDMKIIPLQYDAYHRHFKLVNKDDAKALSDGDVYLLIDFSTKEIELGDLDEVEPTVT
jgi:hypothetical protein